MDLECPTIQRTALPGPVDVDDGRIGVIPEAHSDEGDPIIGQQPAGVSVVLIRRRPDQRRGVFFLNLDVPFR